MFPFLILFSLRFGFLLYNFFFFCFAFGHFFGSTMCNVPTILSVDDSSERLLRLCSLSESVHKGLEMSPQSLNDGTLGSLTYQDISQHVKGGTLRLGLRLAQVLPEITSRPTLWLSLGIKPGKAAMYENMSEW